MTQYSSIDDLMRAADHGDSDACYQMGLIFRHGEGVEANSEWAAEYFNRASAVGHAGAMNELGVMYLQGEGFVQNVEHALSLIHGAAHRGDASAMFNMGIIFQNGWGCAADPSLSQSWFQAACQAGHPQAAEYIHAPTTPGTTSPVRGGRKPFVIFACSVVLLIVGLGAAWKTGVFDKFLWARTESRVSSLLAKKHYQSAVNELAPWAHHETGWQQTEYSRLDRSVRSAWAAELFKRRQYRASAEQYERIEDWEHAGDAYFQGDLPVKALAHYIKAEAWLKAGDACIEAKDPARAAAHYVKAEAWGKAGDAFVKAGSPALAADSYEKAEAWLKAGDVYEMMNSPVKAALCYEKAEAYEKAISAYRRANDHRKAISLMVRIGQEVSARELEQASMWREAAKQYVKDGDTSSALRNFVAARDWRSIGDIHKSLENWEKAGEAYTRLARIDPDVGVRISAARMFERAGDSDKARVHWNAALKIAKQYANFPEILSISAESNNLAEGITYVMDTGDRLVRQDEFFEAHEAYQAVIPYLNEQSPFEVHVHNQFIDRLNLAHAHLDERLEAYPDLVEIEGVNHYQETILNMSRFSHTIISGRLTNSSDSHITSVEIRIKLFKKSLAQMGLGGTDLDLETERDFQDSDAGHMETIVVRNIAPGETKSFSQRLDNGVPYKYFTYPMRSLRVAP